MSLTNEDLLAISQLLDAKLDARLRPIENNLQAIDARLRPIENNLQAIDARLRPIESRLKRIEVDLLENNVIPRLNTIESCYMDTFKRYKDYTDKMDAAFTDIDLLKKVVSEHSEKLQKLA